MNSHQSWAIDIGRTNLSEAHIVGEELTAESGDVVLRLNSFALTANNVTYGLFGEPNDLFGGQAGYWDFFSDRTAPGRLPIWGFATVIDSQVDGVAVGDQFYGYWPMASHVRMSPVKINNHSFTDATGIRAHMPATYAQVLRVEAMSDYRAEHHDLWPIFRPLFMTGWLIADQLDDAGDYGAEQILIASASGKTALGLGFALGLRTGQRPRTIGLTSARHVEAVRALNIYDEVRSYDDIANLDLGTPTVLIDMAGNDAVTSAVHHHFGNALNASLVVGKSHWDADTSTGNLPGAARQGFFAPGRIEKRVGDWGAAELNRRMGAAWLDFMGRAPDLLKIDIRQGADGALAAWQELLSGTADPSKGIIIQP